MPAKRGTILYNSAVFLVWTGTSFLCHFCAKAFLTACSDFSEVGLDMGKNIQLVGLLTLVQIALCYLAVDVNCSIDGSHLKTARLTHILATFATNISLAVMFASSTLAIKLMEPITSAVTVHCVHGTSLSALTVISLPIIVGGAITFSGNPFSETQLSIGVCAAFVSNILLAFRNLAIKKMDCEKQSSLTLRLGRFQITLATCILTVGWLTLLVLDHSGLMLTGVSNPAALCLLSGVFHVAYSYVSTGLVLNELSVVGHAVANIMKRVLVVLLLYLCGKRTASAHNFLGLAICTLGLLIYMWDKQRKLTPQKNIIEDTPSYYRIVPLSFIMVLFGSLVAVFGAFHVLPGAFISAKRSEIAQIRHSIMTYQLPVTEGQTFLPDDPFVDFTFGTRSLKRPEDAELQPDLLGYLTNNRSEIKEFLARRLIQNSVQSGYISRQMETSLEVIKETQRIHYNMFGDAIGKYKYCFLFDIADFENKGDPAITIGEILFIARIGIQVLYYCPSSICSGTKHLNEAYQLAEKYSPNELVILLHGGGNINAYKSHDLLRIKILNQFKGYAFFLFPQSILVSDTDSRHFKLISSLYCCTANLTIVLRDKNSYQIARKHFSGTSRLLMAPDIAFQIGTVRRFVLPVFDILWIRRNDPERPRYKIIPNHPPHLRLHVSDWLDFRTPNTTISLERANYALVMGLFFVQRGRIVITDRLHGHILATLSDIPHVLLDNSAHKLSSYHNTWTSGVKNTRLTNSSEEAMMLALELLKIYGNDVPPRMPWLNTSHEFLIHNYSFQEMNYP